MRLLLLGLVLAIGGADAASAADTTPAAPLSPAAAPAPDPHAKLICEEDEVTGSRLGHRRTCMTAAQWTDYRLALRRDIEHSQDRGLCSDGCASGGSHGKN